ncbi:MBL fold metallo-hydrolase [bacterium]|nr:MBL fold metallo-hydrolase [bacterium]
MKLSVLGSASGMPVPDRNCSAYLIEVDSQTYLIDAGEGIARQLVRYSVGSDQIDEVFISHVHSDHLSGLFMLLQWMHMTQREKPLQIYLPKGVLPGFQAVLAYFHIFQEKWPFRFQFLPISEGLVFSCHDFQLSAVSNGHLSGNKDLADQAGVGSDSYSFILSEKGHERAVYTSDVDSLAHLTAHQEGVGILISECAHLSVDDVIDFAQQSGIPRIILTHIPPEKENLVLSDKQNPMSTAIEWAFDGLVIEV